MLVNSFVDHVEVVSALTAAVLFYCSPC